MREKLARFMVGRNGSDQLSRFVSIVACVALVISMFMVMSMLVISALVCSFSAQYSAYKLALSIRA